MRVLSFLRPSGSLEETNPSSVSRYCSKNGRFKTVMAPIKNNNQG